MTVACVIFIQMVQAAAIVIYPRLVTTKNEAKQKQVFLAIYGAHSKRRTGACSTKTEPKTTRASQPNEYCSIYKTTLWRNDAP